MRVHWKNEYRLTVQALRQAIDFIFVYDVRPGGCTRLSWPSSSKLKSLPSFGPAGSWPNAGAVQMATMNPLQLYMQIAEQWQKACADAMAFWAKSGNLYDNFGLRHH
jgi:hypothetical protein